VSGNDVKYPSPNTTTNYFGRGGYMLSWNFNYGQLSEAIFSDAKTLLNNP